VVESLGAEALVHVDLGGGHRVIAQAAEPCGLVAGDPVDLDILRSHRFDRDSGERLP